MFRNEIAHSEFGEFTNILNRKPDAVAFVLGSMDYKKIKGITQFYQMKDGVIVATSISGLPSSENICKSNVFAYHIHSGGSCSGDEKDSFAAALLHYNPNDCEHPMHAGDLVPLIGNNGYALSIFLTDRFMVKDIIGKTVVIHAGMDDFMTQPSGNSGMKIACGVINRLEK